MHRSVTVMLVSLSITVSKKNGDSWECPDHMARILEMYFLKLLTSDTGIAQSVSSLSSMT
jgi:hypothetical protein